MNRNLKLPLLTALLLMAGQTFAQLNVTSNHTAAQLVQKLLGTGVVVSNEVLTCDSTQASGIFTALGTNLGVDSGIVLTSGSCITTTTATGISGPASTFVSNTTLPNYSDSDLANLIGTTVTNIKDACKLEFDFVPTGDTVKFNYVFASDEYPTYNCSNFNDVFGFFISGPGITGTQNIALVPGTTIPVAINSVNSGANLGPLCTSMGVGSPFTAFYVNNALGTTIAYNGFTTVFTAIANTVPCSTYHIKLAISDKNDQILDSGVFLEAGSLTSNGVSVTNSTTSLSSPTDYIVEGCMPVNIKLTVAQPKPYPITLSLDWSGTATNGTDYPLQANTKVLPAFASLDSIYFVPFSDFITEGLESITLKIYNNSICNNAPLDSVTYFVNDSIILDYSPLSDTICPGDTVMLTAGSDTAVNLAWTPSLTVTDPNSDTTFAFPAVSTTYHLLATYGSCPIANIDIPIEVLNNLTVDAGLDDTICVGAPIGLSATAGPPNINFSYSWSPGVDMNDSTLMSPTYTPLTMGLQSIEVTATTDSGCFVKDTVDILVIEDDFAITNNDTAICQGQSVQLGIVGSPYWEYSWSPKFFLNDTTIINPISTPDTSIAYFAQGSYPGCIPTAKTFFIDVQPNPVVQLGVDRAVCDYDTLYIISDVQPDWYSLYTYSWTPPNAVNDPTASEVIFKQFQPGTTLNLAVTTPAGCIGTDDLVVTVNPGDFLSIQGLDSGFCNPAEFQLGMTGAATYDWTPGYYLSDSTIGDPIIKPYNAVSYEVIGTSDKGCLDTAIITLVPYPSGVVELGEDVEIFDDEELNLFAAGNCSFFDWTPITFLDRSDVSNPTAYGINRNMTYIVRGSTPDGCVALDSIDVIYNDGIVIEMPNVFDPKLGPVKVIKKGNWTLDFYRIYNRWGEEIFSTNDENEGWDGTYQNQAQGIGNFVYYVQGTKPNGEKVNKKGNILLIK